MKKVLVVEDETIVALDLKSRLTSMDYEVVGTVGKGEEAVILALEKKPQCVLMDVQLKGDMDGIETAGRIREAVDVPIIFVTAYGDEETLERVKVQEAFGYILKPYNDREIYTNIEIAIYKHGIEKRLKESEKRLEITLRSIAEGVIATDPHGTITYINPAALTLMGYDDNEVLKKPLLEVFRFKLREELSGSVEESISGRNDYYPSLVFLEKKDQSSIPIEKTESEIKDDLGNSQGRVIVFRDMHERELYEEELRLAKKEAEQANRAKTQLFAGMSHELRTPLNNIIGMADLGMVRGNIDEDLYENFKLIKQGGENLLSVVNSILDFTGLKDGASALEERIFSLREVLEKEFQKLSLRGFRKGLNMYFFYHPFVAEHIKGDDKKIVKVLHQLMENAIKFTDKGYVLVEVLPSEKQVLELRVKDTGVGMSSEVQEIVFNEFTQGSNLYTRDFGGIGIGLTLVKEFMKVLGGNVVFESNPKEGTNFICRLPFTSVPVKQDLSKKKETNIPLDIGGNPILLHCSDDIEKKIIETLFVSAGHPKPVIAEEAETQQVAENNRKEGIHIFCSVEEYVQQEGLENSIVFITPYRNENIPENIVQPRAIGNRPIMWKSLVPLLDIFCKSNPCRENKSEGNKASRSREQCSKSEVVKNRKCTDSENQIVEELYRFQKKWDENWSFDKNEEFASFASSIRNKVLLVGWENCAKDLLKCVFAFRSGEIEKIKGAKVLLENTIGMLNTDLKKS